MNVRTAISPSDLFKMVQRPGADPRLNIVYGIVVDVGYDADLGMYADVKIQPDGNEETCLVGSNFVQDGGGEWNPLNPGDLVLVAIPMGNPGYGPVLFARVWSASAKPATEFHDENSDDPTQATARRTIVVRGATKYRVRAKEGAQISMEVDGDGVYDITATGKATVNITAETTVTVKAPKVVLGEGGAGVAREGDVVVGSISAADVATAIAAVPPKGGIKFMAQIMSASSVSETS